MMSNLSGLQIRALVYAAMFILVAVEWTLIGAALFLPLMQFLEEVKAKQAKKAS